MSIKHHTPVYFCLVAVIGVASSLMPFSGQASAWSDDPKVDTPICTADHDQQSPAIISDGAGGAIITWQDNRRGISNPEIYAQQVNASGNA